MFDALLLAVALAMDSLAVSIVNGLKYKNYTKKDQILSSLSFGFFQGFMPLLGYVLLLPFIRYIENVDHWLVLIILSYLGISMIIESFKKEEIKKDNKEFTIKIMLAESIATSIDALSSCVIIPTFSINPYLTCLIIMIVTALICIVGHKIGNKTGQLLKDKAQIVGGLILIFLGIKCVIEHLFVL